MRVCRASSLSRCSLLRRERRVVQTSSGRPFFVCSSANAIADITSCYLFDVASLPNFSSSALLPYATHFVGRLLPRLPTPSRPPPDRHVLVQHQYTFGSPFQHRTNFSKGRCFSTSLAGPTYKDSCYSNFHKRCTREVISSLFSLSNGAAAFFPIVAIPRPDDGIITT
jgi:hypothetical protein